MSGYWGVVLVAVTCGVAVVLQAQFAGLLDRHLGSIESVFITYGSGGLLIGLTMLALRGGNLSAWPVVPWWALTTGILGLIIVGTIGYSVPRLGLVAALTIITATQFALGALVDHYGWFGAAIRPIDLSRMAGVVILLIGVWLIIR